MSSEQGGLLKTHAENFARHLQTRLQSLTEATANSWDPEDNVSPDNEEFYDISSPLTSPDEELAEPIFVTAQNDNLSLQRSESSSSEYFDTVEHFEELQTSSPVSLAPNLKKIPILHLKNYGPEVNGSINLLDVNAKYSRVSEMPFNKLEPELREEEIVQENCDNNPLIEIRESEVCDKQIDAESVVVNGGGEAVEAENSLAPNTNPEESSLSTSSTFCVFCDIEQIKSSLTSKGPEHGTSNDDMGSTDCESSTSELANGAESLIIPKTSNSASSFYNEESVSLKDILDVLKQEISDGNEKIEKQTDLRETENGDAEQSVCPSIEVRESSPENKDEDEEFDIEVRRKNFRRCSSLKSGKTPPGTPGRKKIVRFADVLGLDLADVKTFLDEVPTIPKSAYEDLHGIDLMSSAIESAVEPLVAIASQLPDKVLVPLFQQPFIQPNFMDRVRVNNVCLESAVVSDMSLFAISGVVRVKNMDFHKSVHVRYTINGWRSFSDLQARYVPNSCDGFSDKFSFLLYAHTLTEGQRLEFAVRYHTAGTQFWDNNGGLNYVFECTKYRPPRTFDSPGVPPSSPEMLASFY